MQRMRNKIQNRRRTKKTPIRRRSRNMGGNTMTKYFKKTTAGNDAEQYELENNWEEEEDEERLER